MSEYTVPKNVVVSESGFLNKLYDSAPFQYLILKPSYFMQSHFIFSLMCVIVIIFIGNFILFSYENDDVDKGHFARNFDTIGDKKEYISSPELDAFHYTLTTISTIGYGDIIPKTSTAKRWTIFTHMLVILMSYKLFDYIYNPNSKSLEAAITSLRADLAKKDKARTNWNNVIGKTRQGSTDNS